MKTNRVPVISKNGDILIPTTWKKAKKLIKLNKAIFVKVGHKNKYLLNQKLESENKIYENTKIDKDNGYIVYLKLKYNPENVDLEKNKIEQLFVLGFDSGSTYNALSIVSKYDNFHIQYIARNSFRKYKNSIKYKMEKRKSHRMERRLRNKLYNKQKTNWKETKCTNTIHDKVQEQYKWISFLCKYFPINYLRYEKFSYNMEFISHKQQLSFTHLSTGWILLKKMLNKNNIKLNIDFKNGWDTKTYREMFGFDKNNDKSIFDFNSHCVDSFVLAYSKLKELINIPSFEHYKIKHLNKSFRLIIPIIYFGRGRRCLLDEVSDKYIKSRGKVIKGGELINVERFNSPIKTYNKSEFTKSNHTSRELRQYHLIINKKIRKSRYNVYGTKIMTKNNIRRYYPTNFLFSHKNMLCIKEENRWVGFVRNYTVTVK